MKVFKRKSLPGQIKYGGRVYMKNVEATSRNALYGIKPKIHFVVVEILPENLKGRLSLQDKQYVSGKWIYTITPYDVRNKS